MTPQDVAALAADLDDAQVNLEADMQAIANDALYEGVLVVLPISEGVDLSWLTCCSNAQTCPCGPKKRGRP